ncbi:lysoplasmalogenase [Oceanobacillus massiliensis]|uniref:lysoplasmalogenase n=1 Tax=Oceanobacillus massiliensis TaxID=1465765 RepID=UPI000288614B|nr:lysoplasmalogenase [Oceanobacillus massiliensis]
MILYRIPLLILAMGLVYLFIAPSEPLIFSLFFKLIPMVLILLYAFQQSPRRKSVTQWLVMIGIVFCMVGDATIHWFMIGLSAFLVGHLFYMTGFFKKWQFSLARFLTIFPIAGYGIIMALQLTQAIGQDGNGHLMMPVVIYISVISVMAFSAIMTGNKWAAIGSILFLISDSILSWNMFLSPVPFADSLIMTTYYGAQFLIAHSLFTIEGSNNRLVW